jgi:hypothetical protein
MRTEGRVVTDALATIRVAGIGGFNIESVHADEAYQNLSPSRFDYFMAAAVNEGTDTARARFGRHAHALRKRHLSLAAVASSHLPAGGRGPTRATSTPGRSGDRTAR